MDMRSLAPLIQKLSKTSSEFRAMDAKFKTKCMFLRTTHQEDDTLHLDQLFDMEQRMRRFIYAHLE